ncbi:MAG: Holliday junction resolvase-like protein, partial [Anaerolineales bacterium]
MLLISGLVIGFLSAALLIYWILSRQMQRKAQEYHQQLQRKIAEYEERIRRLQLQHQEEIKRAREESVAQSRHTIKGQLGEQLVPLLPGFDFHPSDARFIGHPIDYVVFNGYTQLKDGNGSLEQLEIVILDIKRNMAALTREQRAIAQAIQAGRVKFQIVRVDENGKVHSFSVGKKQ